MVLQLLSRCCSWLADIAARKAQRVVLAVLAAGPIPRHVAFIMDGNRRYARMHRKQVQQGHSAGFLALRRVLEICMRLDIRCVSVYAFAIENFKRPPDEVDALMALAEDKLLELCQHGDLLDEYGVRLNVLGNRDLLPRNVSAAMAKAEDMTRHNDRAILNLCMPYAAHNDIATAVRSAVHDAVEKHDPASEITEEDIDARMMTSVVKSPPLDILVRTSGVRRLSDFFLWQCCEDTQLQFSSTYWPDFALRDFVPIVLDYQRKIWASS